MKIAAIGDLHCGHRAGLTPPGWQLPIRGPNKRRNEWGKLQHELWREYLHIIDSIGNVDLLLVNGDCIDGRGQASGSTELITPDVGAQVDMAIECIDQWNTPERVMSYGTAYHTGKYRDSEKDIARYFAATIQSHPFVKIGGITIDMKHKVGRSGIPHGRGTALSKERLWNTQWYLRDGGQPLADLILRSHVHYYTYIGEADWTAMILPPLQAAGTKYGARQCSNTIDWGIIEFDVEDGRFGWEEHLMTLKANKTDVIKL